MPGLRSTGLGGHCWQSRLRVRQEAVVYYSSHLDKITNYNVTIPGKTGFTCSSQVTFSPATTDDVARSIALSVAPAK